MQITTPAIGSHGTRCQHTQLSNRHYACIAKVSTTTLNVWRARESCRICNHIHGHGSSSQQHRSPMYNTDNTHYLFTPKTFASKLIFLILHHFLWARTHSKITFKRLQSNYLLTCTELCDKLKQHKVGHCGIRTEVEVILISHQTTAQNTPLLNCILKLEASRKTFI